jgi:cell division protein FtsB
MEKQALEGLAKQWEGIQSLVSVLDALRVEERSGVDLGDLAVKELQKYAAENAQLKASIEKLKDDHAAKVEALEDAARAHKDQLHKEQHDSSLEVRLSLVACVCAWLRVCV